MKYIHPTAEVSEKARIGDGTKIWNYSQVREGAKIGKNCIISKGVYIDFNVSIGNNVKIQNEASVYHGVTIEDGVFVGPHVCFTNDKYPRAISPEGKLKSSDDWELSKTLVKKGASIGANATVLPGIIIGEWALVGAGAVVVANVPNHALVFGNPARIKGFVCKRAKILKKENEKGNKIIMKCSCCKEKIIIPKDVFLEIK